MEGKSNKGLKFFQILSVIIGFIGFGISIIFGGSIISAFLNSDLGGALALVLFIPILLIASGVSVLEGIVTIVFATVCRRKEEIKTKFNLVMIIIGIILIAAPIISTVSAFVLPNLITSSAAWNSNNQKLEIFQL